MFRGVIWAGLVGFGVPAAHVNGSWVRNHGSAVIHCARENWRVSLRAQNRRFYIAQAHTGAPASSQIFTVLRISDSQDPKISRGERFWKPKREVSMVNNHHFKVADPLRTFKPVPQDSGSRYSTK